VQLKSKEKHLRQIAEIQTIVKGCDSSISLAKGAHASNTLRNNKHPRIASIDLSFLNQILELNKEEMWILVEPRLIFANLCRYTLSHNLIPPVVPEFTNITIGGALLGAALESSSHYWGQVSDICIECEVILGNGEKIIASSGENSDLFYALSGSYGTLGILTAVKIQLIEAKPYVNLTYYRYPTLEEAIEALKPPLGCDFAEGIVFDPNDALVIKGNLSNKSDLPLYNPNKSWSEWYVQHAKHARQPECMPLYNYLFRFDRGAFWMGRYVHSFVTMFQLLFHTGIPKVKSHSLEPNFFFRFLFGWFCSSRKLYFLWHRIPNAITETLFFIHDFYAPFPIADKILNRFLEHTSILPVWLCPIKGSVGKQFLSPHYGHEYFLNIGLYGIPKGDLPVPALSALLEKEIVDCGGRKMLYSYTYYTKEKFSKIYCDPLYDELRKKYFANLTFPTLYNKITNKSIL
jgi:Delta24-sterol reductase